MDDSEHSLPSAYTAILRETIEMVFDQLSDIKVCSLLATLCMSKPRGKFLELGTGTGLGTSWMLEGMCSNSSMITVDNDAVLVNVAKKHLDMDGRVTFNLDSGESVIDEIEEQSIDLIFADTWPGKYNHLEEALHLLKPGGIYFIDDMSRHPDWPDSHTKKANKLVVHLVNRRDLIVTKLDWSTGILICVKT